MKIGIVTFYRVANYGAMLQAYALWKFLEGMGHEVIFVQYPRFAPPKTSAAYCFVTRSFQGLKVKLRNYVRFHITEFAEAFPQTILCRTLNDIKHSTSDCNICIVGSDQMWNPIWCSGGDLPIVMLDFAREGIRRVAYAVSFGTNEWQKSQHSDEARRLLLKFDAISVREQSGVDLVRRLSGREDVRWLVDPTLLHGAAFYKSLYSDLGEKKLTRYVFSYMLEEWIDNENVEFVLQLVGATRGIAELHTDKMPVSGLLSPICKMLRTDAKVPVEKWLSEIANADFVVTNSFHGTVFSILFHVPFLTIPVSGKMGAMNERVVSLLTMVELQSRIVDIKDSDGCRAIINTDINWDEVDRKLNLESVKAKSFLSMCCCGQGQT